MNGYLLSIIEAVLFSGFIVAILPDGKMAGTVKGVAKMVCLLAIIAPIPQYLQKQGTDGAMQISREFFTSTGIQTDTSFIQYYSEMRIRETEQALEQQITEVFSCSAQVSLQTKDDDLLTQISDIEIVCIHVCLQLGETQVDKRAQIREYLIEQYGCEVLIE